MPVAQNETMHPKVLKPTSVVGYDISLRHAFENPIGMADKKVREDYLEQVQAEILSEILEDTP